MSKLTIEKRPNKQDNVEDQSDPPRPKKDLQGCRMHVPLSLVSVQIFANVLRFTTQTMIGRRKEVRVLNLGMLNSIRCRKRFAAVCCASRGKLEGQSVMLGGSETLFGQLMSQRPLRSFDAARSLWIDKI